MNNVLTFNAEYRSIKWLPIIFMVLGIILLIFGIIILYRFNKNKKTDTTRNIENEYKSLDETVIINNKHNFYLDGEYNDEIDII